MSEYGFQSFPEMKTINTFATQEDMAFDSPLMTFRQRSFPQNKRMQEVMDFYYKRPKDFESFVYLSQLNQAEGIKKAISFHRKSKPMTMGTIYWQMNDVWPTMSWSSVDYYGNWKALQYFARKANQNIVAVPHQQNNHFNLSLVSDKLSPVEVKLNIQIKTLQGDNLSSIEKIIKVNPERAIIAIENQSIDAFLTSENIIENQDNLVLQITLKETDSTIFNDTHYFVPAKQLKLKKPELNIVWKKENNTYYITIITKNLAKNVCITSSQLNGRFSDNYFDMMPNETKKIEFIPFDNASNESDFRAISLWNTYN